MGGDICYSLGYILEKFENIQDVLKNRTLNSEKMSNYSAPLVNYLQYNLNIFFDKLNSELDPLNNIIYYIWLECLAVIRYSAIGELEYKPRSSSYEHVNSNTFLEQTKSYLTQDMLHSLASPGRVFKGKINERQTKYLTYVIEVLKELFNCGGSGIPYEKLEQKEFKEIKNILSHYPYDNRKLKVIYNHYMDRNFSLYDYVWILNLLVAKGSTRFIKVKEHEMKVKLEKKLLGLNKKFESTISVVENHRRITSSNEPRGQLRMPSEFNLDTESYDNELDSTMSSIYPSSVGDTTYRSSLNRMSLNPMSYNNMTYDRSMPSSSHIAENARLIPHVSFINDNFNKSSVLDDSLVYDSNQTLNNDSVVKSSDKIKPHEGSRILYSSSRVELVNGNNGRYDGNSSNRLMMNNSNRSVVTNSNRNVMMMNNDSSNINLMMMSRSSMINVDMDMGRSILTNKIYIRESSILRQVDDNGVGYGNGNGNGNEIENRNRDRHADIDNTDKDRYRDNYQNEYRDRRNSSSSEGSMVKIISNSYYLSSNQTLNDSGRNQDEFIRDVMDNIEKTNLDILLNGRYDSSSNIDLNPLIKYNENNHILDSRSTLIDNNNNNSYYSNNIKVINDLSIRKNDSNLDNAKNSNANNTNNSKMLPLLLSNSQDRKVI